MPTFNFTPREANILIDALSQPSGVAKVDRSLAESVRLRMKTQLCQPTTPPKLTGGYIGSHWPQNHVKPEKRPNGFYSPPPKPRVSLPKSTKPLITVDEVLAGLI